MEYLMMFFEVLVQILLVLAMLGVILVTSMVGVIVMDHGLKHLEEVPKDNQK